MYDLCEMGGGPSFRTPEDGSRTRLLDGHGHVVQLLGHADHAVYEVKHDPTWTAHDTKLVWVSMCDQPGWADDCLSKFMATPEGEDDPRVPLRDLGDAAYIYDARTKYDHFERVQKKFSIPYEQMIFFDDRMDNIKDISSLGVHCVFCPDGLTKSVWLKGLEEYSRKHGTDSESVKT